MSQTCDELVHSEKGICPFGLLYNAFAIFAEFMLKTSLIIVLVVDILKVVSSALLL